MAAMRESLGFMRGPGFKMDAVGICLAEVAASPMSPRYTRYTRFNPGGTGSFVRPAPEEGKATRSQHVLEYTLFAIFGLLVLLAAVALYYAYSPSRSRIPNHFADGLKQDRINILFMGVGGDSHPGGGKDLADSILLVSIKPSTKQ